MYMCFYLYLYVVNKIVLCGPQRGLAWRQIEGHFRIHGAAGFSGFDAQHTDSANSMVIQVMKASDIRFTDVLAKGR